MSLADTLKISWTRAQSQRRRTSYRWLLGCMLLLEGGLGLALLACPAWLAGFAPIAAGATVWVRISGAMMLTITVSQLTGWLEPIYQRWQNVLGFAWRVVLAVSSACLGGYVWIFAGAELIAAVWLTYAYWRLLRDELLTRP